MKIEILRVSNLIVCQNGDAQSFLSSLSRYITRRKLELNYIHLLQMSSAVIRWICSILRKVFVEHFLQQTFHPRLSKKCPFNSRYISDIFFGGVYTFNEKTVEWRKKQFCTIQPCKSICLVLSYC
jgi:hypothetical protein